MNRLWYNFTRRYKLIFEEPSIADCLNPFHDYIPDPILIAPITIPK